MRRSKFFMFVVLPVVLVSSVVFILYNYYTKNGTGSTDSGYDFILDHINSKGILVDFKDEICVKSVKDIKFFLTDEEAVIEFGYIRLHWEPKDFVSIEWQRKLEKIGIEMKRDKNTGKLLLFYKEEEVSRWVS